MVIHEAKTHSETPEINGWNMSQLLYLVVSVVLCFNMMLFWLVVSSIFLYIGNSNPNCLSYFSGLKPPTSIAWITIYFSNWDAHPWTLYGCLPFVKGQLERYVKGDCMMC